MSEQILKVEHFSVSFDTYAGEVQAVRDVSFALNRGEILSIVGESGSGKSVMTQSLVKLLPAPPARIKSGKVIFDGQDISGYRFKQLRQIKGQKIAYIFQDPMTSLNPTVKIGKQVTEGLLAHASVSRQEARRKAVELLRSAGIPNPDKRMEQYPHELSGGMRQRVMIAIAIAMQPQLLVADEPTTALDVTIQSQILGTIKDLNRSLGMAVILITHDMGVVAGMAQRVMVMYGGRVVESGAVRDIFYHSAHPYTRSLLAAVPRLDADSTAPLEHIVGSPPDMLAPPAGCPFAPRCRYAMEVCRSHMPGRTELGDGHDTYCWLCDSRAGETAQAFLRGERVVHSGTE
ncbi:MAG: ABC transporter ATP-binding protein [Oscillibacter sp.]|jgi:oligopeptide transport system ATP-binding protein|nr:ABC transporter ATP-binding protein [Oscillibacter sp.]